MKSLLQLTFFGLTPQYRVSLFNQIHEIVFHSNGGYDFHTIYNMPIWLRNFTFNKMKEHYEKEADAVKKSQSGNNGSSTVIGEDGRVKSPEFLKSATKSKPNYTTKASKK